MIDTFTKDQRKALHDSGKKFIAQIETDKGAMAHLVADCSYHAATLSKCWIEKFDAKSAASYRILPDGRLNLIRFFDFRDIS